MVHVGFDIDESVLARFHQAPETFARELRIAAAVKWYEREQLSQGRAAEIAGLSRSEFIDALARYGVSPFQDSLDDLLTAGGAATGGE